MFLFSYYNADLLGFKPLGPPNFIFWSYQGRRKIFFLFLYCSNLNLKRLPYKYHLLFQLLAMAVLPFLGALYTTVSVRSGKPPTPPSAGEAHQKSESGKKLFGGILVSIIHLLIVLFVHTYNTNCKTSNCGLLFLKIISP